MDTSLFLAKALGLFGTVSTLAVILHYQKSLEMEKELTKNPAMTYASGFLILIIGTLIVVSHNVWTADWRVIITILGWLTFFKGALRIFFPDAVKKLVEKKSRQKNFWFAEFAVFLISLFLLSQG